MAHRVIATNRSMVILSNGSGGCKEHPLAENIAKYLGQNCSSTFSKESDLSSEEDQGSRCGEAHVEITESVRGRDVFVIQNNGEASANDSLMEMLITAYACKTSSASRIIAVIPYMHYSRQSSMQKRGCVVAKLMAKLLAKSGICHILTLDLQHKEIHGFFDMPLDNLRASPVIINYIKHQVIDEGWDSQNLAQWRRREVEENSCILINSAHLIEDYTNAVIVANGPATVRRANSYAQRLKLKLAVIHGNTMSDLDLEDGRTSPPPEPILTRTRATLSASMSGSALSQIMNLVGDVSGRIAIIVDNFIDEVESIVSAARFLKEQGAYKVYATATHGILSDPELLEDSPIEEVIVTNTLATKKQCCSKIKTLDISTILGEAIRRIHHGESMAYMFTNILSED